MLSLFCVRLLTFGLVAFFSDPFAALLPVTLVPVDFFAVVAVVAAVAVAVDVVVDGGVAIVAVEGAVPAAVCAVTGGGVVVVGVGDAGAVLFVSLSKRGDSGVAGRREDDNEVGEVDGGDWGGCCCGDVL